MRIMRARHDHVDCGRLSAHGMYCGRGAHEGEVKAVLLSVIATMASPLEARLSWTGSELDVELSSDEHHPLVTLSMTGLPMAQFSTTRVFVDLGRETAGEAVFETHAPHGTNSQETAQLPIRLAACLLVATKDDAGTQCELQVASGQLPISRLTERGDVTLEMMDTGALPTYRIRCMDDHRDESVNRATLTLFNCRMSLGSGISSSRTEDEIEGDEESRLTKLDNFYQEELIMKRHAQYVAEHFQCISEELMPFQTLSHPARFFDTYNGQKQIGIEDGLLFNHPPPAGSGVSEAVLEALLQVACMQCDTTPAAFHMMVLNDTQFAKSPPNVTALVLRVAGTFLRVARPPYVGDHFLDESRERLWTSAGRFGRDGDDANEGLSKKRRSGPKTGTDTLTYVDLANGFDSGDCEDGEKLAFDLFRAVINYGGKSKRIRALRHVLYQYEAVRVDNRCTGDECHVFLMLVSKTNFCRALNEGCTYMADIDTGSAMRNKIHRETARVTAQWLEWLNSRDSSSDHEVIATDYISASLASSEPNVVCGKGTARLTTLLVESTGIANPLSSALPRSERVKEKARQDAYATMLAEMPCVGEALLLETPNNSFEWPDDDIPTNLRSVPGESADSENGTSMYNFYRDVTGMVVDSRSSILARLRDSFTLLRVLVGPASCKQGSRNGAKVLYGVTMEDITKGAFVLYPTIYVSPTSDAIALSTSNNLLDTERQAFRNLVCMAPPPGSAVVYGSTLHENIFYRPSVEECRKLFDAYFDPTLFIGAKRSNRMLLEMDVRALEVSSFYATLHAGLNALAERNVRFTYAVSNVAHRDETHSTAPRRDRVSHTCRQTAHLVVYWE